ncbi:MAG TPA: AAA family ATPase [Dehalococcoidia bacterium]|nr:AAA family ATPase [Dehalococcoidia bacterium]
MPDLEKFRVPWEKTCWSCGVGSLDFQCTDELTPLDHFIGQDRALQALRFGLEIEKPGYNLFVTGLTGTGKASAIKAHLETISQELRQRTNQVPLSDWCYVYNFEDPDTPNAINLPRGMGRSFRQRLSRILEELRQQVPAVFKSEEYLRQLREQEEAGRQATQEAMSTLEQAAEAASFLIQMTPSGMTIFPMRENRPMTGEEYQQLAVEERRSIDQKRNALLQQTQDTMSLIRDGEKETSDNIRALERVVASERIYSVFQELMDSFQDLPEVWEYLNRLIDYLLDNLNIFREPDPTTPQLMLPTPNSPFGGPAHRNPFLPFEVNVLVDESGITTVPIIIEPNPNWGNLFGRIERRASFGTYVSDHTMLKPGAVHLANGGYLVLNARDLLTYPGVWEGLKRVIRNQEIRLEDPLAEAGFFIPQGMRPEPIPLNLKVIITGDETLYRALTSLDYEDFGDLFKVKAEFDSRIDITRENLDAYAAFICRTCEEEKLLPFDSGGVVRVMEHSARTVADQTKLSSRFGQIKDLLIEADYWARKAAGQRVLAQHVTQAVSQKIYRLNLVEKRLEEMIAEGTLLIDLTGAVIGQVNGLAVFDLGDFAFGKPSRITAQTYAGRGGVINIEREAALSGRTHDKGVLILSGYLGAKYGQDRPLTLSVSLAFEQSYDGVDGDSASSTELYAILSSLSGVPLQQNIAVTGSVNQKGEIQPIGGVNQKIEGMFDVCRLAGLTGDQGVMIPHQNVKNLMLREDLVAAIRDGKFHIYAVSTIDEGIGILTGQEAGERQPDGSYPVGSISYLVDRRLQELSQSMRGHYGDLLSAAT